MRCLVCILVLALAAASAQGGEAGATGGNVRAARVMEAHTLVAGALLAANATFRGNVTVGGSLIAHEVRARTVVTGAVETTELSSPSGTIVVDGDLIISNSKPSPVAAAAAETEKKAQQAAEAEKKKEEAPAEKKAEETAEKKAEEAPAKKEEAAPAKKEEAAPAKKEEAASAKKEEAAPAKKEEAAPAKKEEAASAKKEEAASAKKTEAKTQTADDKPAVKAASFLAEELVVGGVKQWKLVRHDDFDGARGAEGWSLAELSSCAAGGRDRFLGGHCNAATGEARKRYENLPPHSQVRVTGRYHFIDAWKGETAFLKLGERFAWADRHTAPAPGLGIHMCGSADHAESRMSQPVDVTAPHSASFLEVAFGSTGEAGQDACQRSFGVDDVMVYVR